MKRKGRNYQQYTFHARDWCEFVLLFVLKAGCICYLFYDSYKAAFLLLPFAYIDYRRLYQKKRQKQREQLILQFKSLIEALVTALNAGYSLEHAFEEAGKDLALLYEPEAIIFEEVNHICSGLRMNTPLEVLLKDFGVRSQVEDIINFANVVTAAKKSGGNLIRIIQKTVNCISDKLAVEEDITTMITAKKLEARIMTVMPYGILLYLRITSGPFLKVLYHNTMGVACMTLFLVLIYSADCWANRIMEVPV